MAANVFSFTNSKLKTCLQAKKDRDKLVVNTKKIQKKTFTRISVRSFHQSHRAEWSKVFLLPFTFVLFGMCGISFVNCVACLFIA